MSTIKIASSIACASVLLATSAVAAKFPESAMQAKTFTSSTGQTIGYRIYVPEVTNATEKVPAVLFLHGAGERGTNNTAQLVHGVPQIMKYVIDGGHPAIVIAPQCPTGMQWVNAPWNAQTSTMNAEPSKPLQAVIELVEKELASSPVDRSRIYVTGISMGGYGTWEMLQRFPEQFAAGMPICGGGDTNLASKLVSLPIFVVHGDKDGAVPVFRSRSMVEAIKAAGGTNVIYQERPGEGHNVWGVTYGDEKNIEWLFSHKKAQ